MDLEILKIKVQRMLGPGLASSRSLNFNSQHCILPLSPLKKTSKHLIPEYYLVSPKPKRKRSFSTKMLICKTSNFKTQGG